MKMHPVRAARVAIMHTWQSTQTEGWWRQAFDFNGIPYDYISTQDVAKNSNLNAKYDVIIFGPGGGAPQAHHRRHADVAQPDAVEEHAGDAEHRRRWAQTDDMRPGLGYDGLENLQQFVKNGGVLHRLGRVGAVRDRLRHDERRVDEHRGSRHGDGHVPADAARRRCDADRVRRRRQHRGVHATAARASV